MKAFMIFRINENEPYNGYVYMESEGAQISAFKHNQNAENPPEFEVCEVEIEKIRSLGQA